jgi:hypothetical protein
MNRGLALLLVVVLVLPACGTMSGNKKPVAELEPVDSKAPYTAPDVQPPGLALSSEQRFKDVPLPAKVKEDPDRTFVFESATLQVGRMVYTTRDQVVDIANFYIKECPTAGWKLVDVLEADGKALYFTKTGKRLIVNVQDHGVAVGRRLTVTVTPDGGNGTF